MVMLATQKFNFIRELSKIRINFFLYILLSIFPFVFSNFIKMMIIPTLNKGKPKKDNEEKPQIPKTASDLQRLKLEKLMKNPDKPILIPERPKEKGTPHVPDFVRNVMGSSAGAGSGEFHVYRHLRRKEYARQKYIQIKGEKELLEDKYHERIEENKRIAEEKTAKKRAKRLKKKEKLKNKPKRKKCETISKEKSSEESDSESECEIDNKELVKESNSDNKKFPSSSTEIENQESHCSEMVSNKSSSPSKEENNFSKKDTLANSDNDKEEKVKKELSSSSSE